MFKTFVLAWLDNRRYPLTLHYKDSTNFYICKTFQGFFYEKVKKIAGAWILHPQPLKIQQIKVLFHNSKYYAVCPLFRLFWALHKIVNNPT